MEIRKFSFVLRLLVLATIALLPFSIVAQAVNTKTVKSVGFGRTIPIAEEDAVVRAIKSATGMQISISEDSMIDSSEASVGIEINGAEANVAAQSYCSRLQKSLQTRAQGRMAGYEVVSKRYDESASQWEVEVAVEVYGQYIVGRDPNNLRRMFVASFQTVNEGAKIYNSTWHSFDPAETFRLKAEDLFTATRKFTMLDRQYTDKVKAELSFESDGSWSTADLCKIGQRLKTDYMVVGKIEFFTPPDPYTDKFTSRIVWPDGMVSKVHYRVILVPTQQLKCAGSVEVRTSELSGSTAAEIAVNAMNLMAEKAVAKIMEGILPFRVESVIGDNIVIGQGGSTLHVGEILELYSLGDVVVDSVTKEVIDRIEIPVGVAKITRVTPKLSYARIIDGDISIVKKGDILRRDLEGEVECVSAEESASDWSGKLPFDK